MNNRKAAGLGLLCAALGLLACSSPPLEERFEGATWKLRHKEYGQAIAEVDAALGQLSGGQSDPWGWRFRLLKAEILIAAKAGAKPPETWARDAEIAALLAQPAPMGRLEARRVLVQGKRAKADGESLNAERLFEQARRQAASLADWNLLTEIEYELSGLRKGDYEKVLETLLPLAERPWEDIDPYVLTKSVLRISYNNLMLQYWGPARDWAERARAPSMRAGYPIYEALRLVNLATAQNRLGYLGAAKGNLDEAVEMARRNDDAGNLGLALQERGSNAFFKHDYQLALDQYQLAEKVPLQPQDLEKLLYNQFVALMEMHECARARRAWARYENIRASPLEAADTYSEAQIWRNRLNQGRLQHICGESEQARQSYERVAQEASRSFRLRALTGMGLLEAEQQRLKEANRHFESAIQLIREGSRPVARTEDELAAFSALMDVYRIYVHTLLQQGELKKALEVADSSRGFLLREKVHEKKLQQAIDLTATADHFQRMSRRTDAVFLFYWVSNYGCQVWVLKGGDLIRVPLPIQAEQLKEQVRRYIEGMVRNLRDPDSLSSGFRLSEALLAPALKYIPPGSQVVLVLDEELHGLSFGTLPVGPPDGWHYWIEDVALSIAPSLGQLALSKRRSSPPSSDFLLVGDPDYADPEDQLGSAEREISSIEGHLAAAGLKVIKRIGPTAQAAEVLNLLKIPSARGLHVAAHAVVEPFQPLDSAILLTPAGTLDKLYARQILNLAPLQLNPVVLSACETFGDYAFSGEGPVGLAWAFMAAGSCDVVASIWEVPDSSTEKLMDAFYANLSNGQPYAEALREAKLQFISKKPIFWGGFQHYLGCPD